MSDKIYGWALTVMFFAIGTIWFEPWRATKTEMLTVIIPLYLLWAGMWLAGWWMKKGYSK